MAKNLPETGFGVYRSTQLGHIPFFLLLYLLVGPSIKTKVGDVVGCIFEVECSIGGFLILKQIIIAIKTTNVL
jgi:hypothetical protein